MLSRLKLQLRRRKQMVKFIIGIVVGVCIVQFNILPMISDAFVSTGARDMVVFTLKEIK